MVPTERDLRFAWEEMPQQMLDEQQQKVRDSLRAALIGWARGAGRGQRLHRQPAAPVPASGRPLVRSCRTCSATARSPRLLAERPQLKTLLLHNIDTLGADVDPALLGQHLESGACLSFEVITRRLEDRGGGLARVNGRPRLVEGLAMPREEAEFALTYYNTLTTWIDLDRLLDAFGLTRDDFAPDANADEKITTAIRNLAAKMPTYITLKDVKKRWGHGQEDIFPGHAIREALGRHDRAAGDRLALPRRPAPPRPAAQGSGAARRLAARRLRGLRRVALRVGVTHRKPTQAEGAPPANIAAERRCISSGDTSSTCVAKPQRCPNGSSRETERSP